MEYLVQKLELYAEGKNFFKKLSQIYLHSSAPPSPPSPPTNPFYIKYNKVDKHNVLFIIQRTMQSMKTIPNHPDYKITEDGQVWSNRRVMFLKPSLNRDGYETVKLCSNGKQWRRFVHRLMALTYLPNPENRRCVDHINGNRKDNRLSNIQWKEPRKYEKYKTPIGHGSVKWIKRTNQQKRWQVRWSMNGKKRAKNFLEHDDAERHRRLLYFLRQYIIKR